MRTLIRITAAVSWLLAAAFPAEAATPTEFYLSLLRRGTMDVEAGQYQRAITPLRIAAFGFVDSIEHYQTAQVHLAVASEKLGEDGAAREAVRRVLAAQRLEPKYGSLRLSTAVRSAFDALARRVLQADEVSTLQTAPKAPRQDRTEGTTDSPAAAVVPRTDRETPVANAGVEDAPPAAAAVTPAPGAAEPAPVATATAPAAPVDPAAESPATMRTQAAETSVPHPVAPLSAQEAEARFAKAQAALEDGRLPDARNLYRSILADPAIARNALIRVGEGLYRSRDFTGTIEAFRRAGDLRPGEEPYRFCVAVALYESGEYDQARTELAAALPFIEATPDVVHYRDKIEKSTR